MNSWGTARNMRDLVAETTTEKLMSMDSADHKRLLFDALRAGNLAAIRNLFGTNRSLLSAKLGGYEGADVYETIPNVRCLVVLHPCWCLSPYIQSSVWFCNRSRVLKGATHTREKRTTATFTPCMWLRRLVTSS
jgi:hypothetical protein